MRLLHTTKLKVEEFVETGVQSYHYAILSHAWSDEEVTFQDMQGELPRHKKGFSKLENSCILANKDGYDYIWIDTCCIDKTSSAELSEAINSMYRWYEEAKVCYAYLSDVPSVVVEDPKKPGSKFATSKWFTRGWTLQELIAPKQLTFYCDCWSKLGSKSELIDFLAEITGIGRGVLINGKRDLEDFSIAKKMSWAAKRTTTRLEDRAYSLLGIFDINMPLLYGEGKKAFIRLQEEILKQTDDDSLFAHQIPQSKIEEDSGSLLAESLDYFSQSGEVSIYTKSQFLDGGIGDDNNVPTLVTSKGLQVHSFGCPCTYNPSGYYAYNGWLMILDCHLANDIFMRPAVFLESMDSGPDQFMRISFKAVLVVRPMDGKPILDRWNVEPRFQGASITFDKKENPNLFIPDFENIRKRTIFVRANHSKTPERRIGVLTRHITQPLNRNFRKVGWSENFEEENELFGWYVRKGGITTISGQLMFQEQETGHIFVLIFALGILDPPEKVSRAETDLRYRTWCAILELDCNTPSPELNKSGKGPFEDLEPTYLENKAYVAMSALDDGFIVQATLCREEFWGRTRFVLDVNLQPLSDETLWKKMRDKRTKAVDRRENSTKNRGVIGYRTIVDEEVLSIASQIEKLLKDEA